MSEEAPKWRITLQDPGPAPFCHPFKVQPPPTGCDCAWACRTLDAAMRIVDAFVWLERHREIDGCFDNRGYQRHLDHIDQHAAA